jgi:hypothetical protein
MPPSLPWINSTQSDLIPSCKYKLRCSSLSSCTSPFFLPPLFLFLSCRISSSLPLPCSDNNRKRKEVSPSLSHLFSSFLALSLLFLSLPVFFFVRSRENCLLYLLVLLVETKKEKRKNLPESHSHKSLFSSFV